MPQHNFPSQTGDLHIEITVKFPASITEEQKEGTMNENINNNEEWKEITQLF